MKVSRLEALSLADDFLKDNNLLLTDEWTKLTKIVEGKNDVDDQFIWETQNKEIYDNMLGGYLDHYFWSVRYVKFEGTEDERTEEYEVIINNDGSLNQIRHKIPENRTGDSLTEHAAREIALSHLYTKFNKNLDLYTEVSVEPSSLPNRTDWSFVFSDKTTDYIMTEGDLRVKINISDNEVVSSNRFTRPTV